MRLAFKQNTDRQILALLLRVLTANSTIDWPLKQEEGVGEIEEIVENFGDENKQGFNGEIVEEERD